MNARNICLPLALLLTLSSFVAAQKNDATQRQRSDLVRLIDQYAQARQHRDTTLLRRILTDDVDQLVSTGEWRMGMQAATQGMLASSAGNPGDRTLTVEKIKMLDSRNAILDCRYQIKNADGTMRNMWSTFVAVNQKGSWKISAIRNMLPSTP